MFLNPFGDNFRSFNLKFAKNILNGGNEHPLSFNLRYASKKNETLYLYFLRFNS